MLGYGYVWNAPPFRPVQGYTSFLWVVILEMVWRLLGVPPPESANVLSLLFAGGTLALTSAMVLRQASGPAFQHRRAALLAIVLLGVLTNRTFLAWTSSGLETAMFDFLLILWVYLSIFVPPAGGGWLFSLSMATAFLCRARPDGIVFAAATVPLAGLFIARRSREGGGIGRALLGTIPLLLIPAHLLWQRVTYGSWTPNTYAAKVVGAWPQSGIRYFLSFVMEYFLWPWLAVMTVATWRCIRELIRSGHAGSWPGSAWIRNRAHRMIVVGALVVQFLYYTLIVGGDHFEYRVYNHLIPMMFVSFIWGMDRLGLPARRAIPALGLSVLLSWPIPWVHFALTSVPATRAQTIRLIQPVAPSFPWVLRWYPAGFDILQTWLIRHSVCRRHQEHKIFYEAQVAKYPPREESRALPEKSYPIFTNRAVGLPGWVFPHMAIIDRYGLNDLVIARTPVSPMRFRKMAHDREAPAGYLECFQPNIAISERRVYVVRRKKPLTADDIRACEARFLD